MTKVVLLVIGGLASAVAVAGALLPGLPATPFVLVALWAFARSSPRLHGALLRMPVLRAAVEEARRFETRRSVRLPVKIFAIACAWGSAALALAASRGSLTVVPLLVTLAAVGGTAFMLLIPTDRS
jgi:uncharacterized membrane protein YbaN (DUF454 family)